MNSVEIIGVCKEVIDEIYRKIEYSLPCFNDDNKNSQEIICTYWQPSPGSRLSNIPLGSHVAIR